MKLILKIIFTIAGNALALSLAARYVAGFGVTGDIPRLAALAFLFALLNFLVRPLLKLLFGPIILLTLGLGIFIVNAIMLFLLMFSANHLDALRGSITIENVPALVWATLIITAVNWIVHIVA